MVQAAHNKLLLTSLGFDSNTVESVESWSNVFWVNGSCVHLADLPDFACLPLTPTSGSSRSPTVDAQ